MLRGIEKWITYFVLLIVFILGLVFLGKQIHVTNDLKQGITQSNIASPDFQKIVGLHNASSKIFFLTFLSLCLLLLGIIIMMKRIERAYDYSEVKEKVRYHLKTTTPAMAMVVIGAFLLAFCTFRSSKIESLYAKQLVDNNRDKFASENNIPNVPLGNPSVDSNAMTRLKSPNESQQIDTNKNSGLNNASNIVSNDQIGKNNKSDDMATLAQSKSNPSNPDKTKQAQANTLEEKAQSNPLMNLHPNELTKKESDSKGTISKPNNNDKKGNSSHIATSKKAPSGNAPITPADISWAGDFQRNVVVSGYNPTKSEEQRYSQVLKKGEKEMNSNLSWAYQFLQKTKKGYQPTNQELQRFETVVQQNLTPGAN
ncbi:MAG: hypothetical protein JST52_00940 [Bacteroidetes bacterium]|nr:hypothetical protein [Bacteroidota bacterium]MBS1739179.1 hypothetical protein [Bacteroidota bacterium]